MRILLYQWEAYSERSLYKALKELGHEVICYSKKIKNHIVDEEFLKDLALLLIQQKVELVMSFDFFPMVSMACRAAHIKYASWIFGTPHYSLYSEAVFYGGNYIFCFDHMQCQMTRECGVEHVFHLPLAVDIEVFENSIMNSTTDYKHDVSFVGTMYTDERNYFEQIQGLSKHTVGYIEGICEAQLKIYGYNLIKDVLSEELIQDIEKHIKFSMDPGYFLTVDQFLVDIINKKVTIMERSRTLEMLSEEFDVIAYTNSNTTHIPKLHNGGYVHYYNTMPKIFRDSKINLNITMRSITTGIPLRVLDVLGCKGFLITNYQEEIAEYFEDGKELVMYSSLEELYDKVSYYLVNDDERDRISEKGYEKVKKEFNYKKQLGYILKIVMES